jgi:hypothetical protein
MMNQGSFRLHLLCLLCGLVVAACTTTAPPSQSTSVATAAKTSETAAAGEWRPAGSSQEVICTYETPTGTRFRRRLCATQAERDRRQQDDRETMEKAQRKGAQVNPRDPGG